MRIAFVSLMKILPWGGSEELWYKAAKLAVVSGHTVSTLTQQWPVIHSKIVELNELGVNTQFFYVPSYSKFDRIKFKARIKERVEEIIPDIIADIYVISNGSVFDYVYNKRMMKYILATNKPFIMISQHNFENGNIVATIQREYAIEVINKSSKYFFVSERNLKIAERQLAHSIGNADLISNPLNISNIEINEFPLGDKLLMACVARLDCAFKGQDILLQVLSSDIWKHRDYSLKLYGSGPHLAFLQQLIVFYNLQNKVTIEGHVQNVEMIWKTNQVLLMPSLSEGTPLALVEAMLSGRAVLATDVGDNGKYVLNNKTGFLASTASIECLNFSLEHLWQNRDKLKEMGQTAFAHAIQITDMHPDKKLINFALEVLNEDTAT